MRDCHVPVLVPLADWQHRVQLRRENKLMPEQDMDMDYLLLGPMEGLWVCYMC